MLVSACHTEHSIIQLFSCYEIFFNYVILMAAKQLIVWLYHGYFTRPVLMNLGHLTFFVYSSLHILKVNIHIHDFPLRINFQKGNHGVKSTHLFKALHCGTCEIPSWPFPVPKMFSWLPPSCTLACFEPSDHPWVRVNSGKTKSFSPKLKPYFIGSACWADTWKHMNPSLLPCRPALFNLKAPRRPPWAERVKCWGCAV